jgi:pimeloyl-ACP methyl ester carboxylesterase
MDMIGRLAALLLMTGGAMAEAQPARLVGDLPRKDERPLESLAGVETEYGAVRTSEGHRLRTILTRPAGTTGRLPAIFHTQAVSCGSLELPTDRPTFFGELARRSGMVLIRVERAGTGDSEGPACEALDYDTEVRHYREALDQLAEHAWVDARRIFLFGMSLGSTTAPLVAQGRKIAGIVVQGGGAHTYLERMIQFERLYLERSGKFSPERIHDEMVRRIAFHQAYLIEGKTPPQVAAARPDLAGVWEGIRGAAEAPPHYGRPYAWHWQAAKKNFLAGWARIEAPVLVAYAQYDQFEPLSSHKLIVDSINRLRPGTASLLTLEGLDHSLRRYPDELAAYAEEGGEPGREALLVPMIAWLKTAAAGRVSARE